MDVALLALVVIFAVLVTAVATSVSEVTWGRGGSVPMSLQSRLLFAALVWMMTGVIVTGISGLNRVRVILLAGFLIAVVLIFISSFIDKHRWNKRAK